MITHSIRWRILAWNFALLTAVAAVLLVAFHRHERENRIQDVDTRLGHALFVAMPTLHEAVPGFEDRRAQPGRPPRPPSPPGPRPLSPQSEERLNDLRQAKEWCLVMSVSGRELFRGNNAPKSITPAEAVAMLRAMSADGPPGAPAQPAVFTHGGHRILLHHPPNDAFAMIGVDLTETETALNRLAISLTAAGVLIVGAGCGVGWWLAGRSLRPIERISATAELIARGDHARRIDVSETESELGRLATVLNDTFDGMNAARERVVRFTADASHELRTPLSVILTEGQRSLRRDRTPEEYRESLATIDRAARRMKAISDGLLELSSGDLRQTRIETLPCDLADLADETLALVGALAAERGVRLESDLESCPMTGDPAKLGRMILNLVSNAILHNAGNVRVRVTTRPEPDAVRLEVADDGIGIAPEQLGRIFERFHRADASRSRHTGGAGLGLAIVKQTVEAHRGTVTVTSSPGAGATFTVRIPVAAR